MKSKTSFINGGILQNDLKRFTWIGVVYLLGLLLAVPWQVYMAFSRAAETTTINAASTYLRLLNYDSSALQMLLLVVIPVLTGLLLFRYLQAAPAGDMEHALPIRRETLYNTHVLAGIIFLCIPLALTALVTWALAIGLGIEQLDSRAVLTWLGTGLLINLLFFMTTTAIGMFTGMTTLQGISTYILLLLPTGLSILLLQNMNMFIYGFPYDHYRNSTLDNLSPLLRLTELPGNSMQTSEIIAYLLIIAALYLLGRYLYQRRPLERAGNAVTFDILGPTLKYGVVFCSMLLAGSYFYDGRVAWTFFGYLLGSLLAYILMQILLQKSLNVFQWNGFKGYGIYALVVIAMLGVLNFDGTGYAKRLPEFSEVQSIYLDTSFYALDYSKATHAIYNPQSPYPDEPYWAKPVPAIFTESDNLANILALHRAIISHHGENQQAIRQYHRDMGICLVYELKDGSRLYRQYRITPQDYATQLKPIYESREYKKLHNEILRINPSTAILITVIPEGGNKQLHIAKWNPEPDLVPQAIQALRQDIYEQTYEEMNSRKAPWAHISISLPNRGGIDLAWHKSYVNFERWLKTTGQYEQARLLPTDIRFALVQKISDPSRPASDRSAERSRTLDIEGLEKRPGTIKITVPQELEQCLRNYHNGSDEKSAYYVAFVLQKDRTLEGFFPAENAPAFLKERLE